MRTEELNIKIHYQTAQEFKKGALWLDDIWYGRWIRGYVIGDDIYINRDAWFGGKWDKIRLVLHEIGHILAGDARHTKIPGGVMHFSGLLRW